MNVAFLHVSIGTLNSEEFYITCFDKTLRQHATCVTLNLNHEWEMGITIWSLIAPSTRPGYVIFTFDSMTQKIETKITKYIKSDQNWKRYVSIGEYNKI